MKTVFLIHLFLGLMCSATNAADTDRSLQIAIALPQNRHNERVLSYSGGKKQFHVIVNNATDMPKRIWQEWCSWGYFALSLELTGNSGETWTVKKKTRVWFRNYPDYWTLGPHESLVLDVEFADGNVWDGFPRPQGVSQKFKMRAVFEIRPEEYSREHSIWTGRAVSKAEEYVFYN
jgi:hypothetical protein